MEAIISVSKNGDDKFSNAIIIAKSEINNSLTARTAGSCKVCGVSSAYSCLKKLQKEVSSDEFDVHVKRNGDCVTLSWK
jgi:nicotinate-nucleotide pyrophosphorylase